MLHVRREELAGKFVRVEALPDGESGSEVELLDLIGTTVAVGRNTEIFAEDDPADHLYKVVSGAVRTCRLMSDGRRHIGAFYLPGDVFGLEAGGTHSFAAEALGDGKILVVRKSLYLAYAAADEGAIARLWEHTARHLQRAQNHMFLLGRKSAQERIAAFLLDMADRLSDAEAVDLPMARQDIADYLGLTIETVSRTLTQMERDRVVAIPTSRRIVLRNRRALIRMNDCMAPGPCG